MMGRPDYLFSKADWFAVQEHQKKRLLEDVSALEGNRLLNTSIDDLADYFNEKYSIDVPTLLENEIVADQQETRIDVSRDQMRFSTDRSRPFYVAGVSIEITIPFKGETELFQVRPTTFTFSPPRGELRGNQLILQIEGVDLKPEQVRASIDRTISEINQYLETLRNDAAGLNGQLRQLAKSAIESRRGKLLGNQNLVSALGFSLKERHDAPRTYIAPDIRKKIVPTLPPASTRPFKPEPTISMDDYDHILNVIQNMARVMELSPSAFTSMDEEALRSHFLVQLNGHYEGSATGETFNYEGKTDILIRVNGKNVFIAECKYWNGPKKLHDTIDQLLSYSSWRDTKVAVIIFNRKKKFSSVIEAIPATVESHSNFKRFMGKLSETTFRYIFSHRDDPNREMIITVLAFDVPS